MVYKFCSGMRNVLHRSSKPINASDESPLPMTHALEGMVTIPTVKPTKIDCLDLTVAPPE
ncbi:hypothetical protein PI125_g6353 [Phytophthora idaei]|nr:hypothetical protein PC120_g11988 [Phytophthora cactorum]KAG3114530.1 hypothetical protein PI125_g6353 [Phytophthora idaei]